MDRADDGAASTRQRLEQRDTLEARRAVQTTVTDRAQVLLETVSSASVRIKIFRIERGDWKMLELVATSYLVAV